MIVWFTYHKDIDVRFGLHCREQGLQFHKIFNIGDAEFSANGKNDIMDKTKDLVCSW